ncbi:hypothetical protein, variant [Saprolegnia diclina VS20]|uniref:PA14 domain-containing protein n=1 Tax=Saprolegnia diclina (strain VS20) TaxID=1156394 RepID=T0QDL0_SAPDV|nr:hypothetical protein, variant [Saprolegnia diclina VS20]EQC32836.1 hypothetical protein, variant [Saprolegnia diclina VS20]|eukprot:XP_008613522.1 hypothetical protein, variant [Saprolegnia diclina VS20]
MKKVFLAAVLAAPMIAAKSMEADRSSVYAYGDDADAAYGDRQDSDDTKGGLRNFVDDDDAYATEGYVHGYTQGYVHEHDKHLAPGPRGKTGDQGKPGKKGDRGARGPRGYEGDKGDRGNKGAKGDKGERGENGKRGDEGPKGNRGPEGKQGAKGPEGDAGDHEHKNKHDKDDDSKDVKFGLFLETAPYASKGQVYAPPKGKPQGRATTAPPLAKGEKEFNQFWSSAKFCDAELALTECLIQCNVITDFASSSRVAKCIQRFSNTLCPTLPADGCDTGRVTLSPQNCSSDAVVAAMYTIGEIQKTTIGNEKAPVDLYKADNPDSFSAIKLAVTMQALVNYGNCVGGSLLNYADKCNAQNFFNSNTNTCVNDILATCNGKATNEATTRNPIQLGDILTTPKVLPGPPTTTVSPSLAFLSEDDASKERLSANDYIRDHHTEDAKEVEKLSALIKGADAIEYRKVEVTITEHKSSENEAGLSVCPNSYTPLNYRLPFAKAFKPEMFSAVGGIPASVVPYDVPGFPLDDIAFHFPAQTFDPKTLTWKPAVYAKGTANQFPEGTPLDPLTPKGGIRDTCEKFHFLSMLAWFAGEDTGDYCFTIDGYTAEFVESGEVHPLSWDEVQVESRCSDTQALTARQNAIKAEVTVLKTAPKDAINALSTKLAVDQSALLGVAVATPGCASCYNIKWRDPAYCPRHIARFGMQLRCCKSFANTMDARIAKTPSKKRVACGSYSDEWDGVCTAEDNLEFSHTVYSKVGKGELQPRTSSYYTNKDGVSNKVLQIFAIFQGALKNLSATQQKLFLEVLAFFNWNTDCSVDAALTFDRPTRTTYVKVPVADDTAICIDKPDHSYITGNAWCDAANSLLQTNVDWSTLLGLEPKDGKCYAPTCLLSRYVTCSEAPVPAPKTKGYYVPHAREYTAPESYDRKLLAAPNGANVYTLSAMGFMAGMAAIVVGQVVLAARRDESAESPYHQQLL